MYMLANRCPALTSNTPSEPLGFWLLIMWWIIQLQEPQDLGNVRERLIQKFPTVPVAKIDELISTHAGNEDICVSYVLASADESGDADITANYERVCCCLAFILSQP